MTKTARERPDGTEEPGRNETNGLAPGAVVVDRDDDDPDEAIVVNTPSKTAAEWDVPPRGCTLAEDNPSYPEDAAVIVVVFREELDETRPEYDGAEPLSLSDLEAYYYSFPEPRLRKVDGLPGREEDESGVESVSEELEALRSRLEDAGDVTLERNGDGPVVVLEKLGETYRITEHGEIDGDGALRDRLEDVVEEVIGA